MVIGAMYVRFVLFLGFRSSVAANSGRVYDGMSTLAPFVVDPGSVLGASPSMLGVVSPTMKEKMSAMMARAIDNCRQLSTAMPAMMAATWRLAPWYAFRMFLRRRLPLLVLPHVGPWRLIGSLCPSSVALASCSSSWISGFGMGVLSGLLCVSLRSWWFLDRD